jgi:dihydroxyacetone kinase
MPKPLAIDECEVGLGLHNEAGVYRRKIETEGKSVSEEMVTMLLERRIDNDGSCFVERDDETVLFVNNLGGVSQLEMGALLADLVSKLGRYFPVEELISLTKHHY